MCCKKTFEYEINIIEIIFLSYKDSSSFKERCFKVQILGYAGFSDANYNKMYYFKPLLWELPTPRMFGQASDSLVHFFKWSCKTKQNNTNIFILFHLN